MPRRPPDRRRIYDDIRAKILSGEYPPGFKLPSYREMKDAYRVSEEPVRTAIAMLSADGWVETQQGKGTFVAQEPPAHGGEADPE